MHLDDQRVRLAAFNWLEEKTSLHGDVLPRTLLAQGFELDGQRVPLVSRQGIFKPKVLPEIPLSITTTLSGEYDDSEAQNGLILYSYRGTDLQHRENVGLRKAMQQRIPLVYFLGIIPGQYMAIWPVFIVGDRPEALKFEVLADDMSYADYEHMGNAKISEESVQARRSYITAVVQRRMHQRGFRERVLQAYRDRCALCSLRHRKLLDAAHIIPDGEPGGEPVVSNGLSMCKLHHAAFDKFFLGIRPDYVVEVRRDILDETDGPMLLHGLQGLHGTRILVPHSLALKPKVDLLERRYERFKMESLSG